MIAKALVRKVFERDGNRCAWTGTESDRLVPHHRANRGHGGRPSLNRLSNLILLDSHINGMIESNHEWAAEARRRGVKISSHANPSLEPVWLAWAGWVRLDDFGGVTEAQGAA